MIAWTFFFARVFVDLTGLESLLQGVAQQNVIDAQAFVPPKGRFSIVPP
jgi:hypothetical protein